MMHSTPPQPAASGLARRGFLTMAAAGGTLLASSGVARANTVVELDVVRQFGARGDGVADDTAAFLAMHDAARKAQAANANVQVRMILGRGRTFNYSWNRWTWGLRRVTVVADGAAVRNISRSAWDIDKTPLNTNRGFFHYYGFRDAPADATASQLGQFIQTALRGQDRVALKNAAAAGTFKVNRHVLVYSYCQQQYGQPPNPRHVDIKRIKAISGGVITLDSPLAFDHRDDYPHVRGYIHCPGMARILMIDRDDVRLGVLHRIEGLRTLQSPYARGATGSWEKTVQSWLQATGVLRTELVDCDLQGIACGEGRQITIQRSKIAYAEPDKCLEKLNVEGGEIRSLQSCAGVGSVTFTGTTFIGMAMCLAIRQKFSRCHFKGPLGSDGSGGLSVNGQQPIVDVQVDDCTFYGRNAKLNPAIQDIQPYPRVTIGSGVTLLSGSVLQVPMSMTYGSAYQKLIDGARVGGIISIDSVRGGFARVSRIWGDASYGYLQLQPSTTLSNGMVLRMRLLEKLTVRNAVLSNCVRINIDALQSSWNGTTLTSPPTTLVATV